MDGTGDVELSNDLSEIMECVRCRMHVSLLQWCVPNRQDRCLERVVDELSLYNSPSCNGYKILRLEH